MEKSQPVLEELVSRIVQSSHTITSFLETTRMARNTSLCLLPTSIITAEHPSAPRTFSRQIPRFRPRHRHIHTCISLGNRCRICRFENWSPWPMYERRRIWILRHRCLHREKHKHESPFYLLSGLYKVYHSSISLIPIIRSFSNNQYFLLTLLINSSFSSSRLQHFRYYLNQTL